VDGLNTAHATAAVRVAESLGRIRKLGALPADVDQHAGTPAAALRSALRGVHGAMAGAGEVNKNAQEIHAAAWGTH